MGTPRRAGVIETRRKQPPLPPGNTVKLGQARKVNSVQNLRPLHP